MQLIYNDFDQRPFYLMAPFMDHLESIDLSDNLFNFLGYTSGILSVQVFPHMKNLTALDMRNSEITLIHEKTFRPLSNLR